MAPLEEAPIGPRPGEAGGERSRAGAVALAAAVAALLSSWNPFAAPLGLAVGVASLLLGVRALRRRLGSRRVAWAAIAAGALAAAASGLVLALTAGAVTGELPGEPVVRGRTPAEAARLLDEEASRTAVARERARRELERSGKSPAGAGAGSAREDGALPGGAGKSEPEGEDEAE